MHESAYVLPTATGVSYVCATKPETSEWFVYRPSPSGHVTYKNFTGAKMERRLAQIDQSVVRYLSQLDSADLQEPSEALAAKTARGAAAL
jgi:hypothetical protein